VPDLVGTSAEEIPKFEDVPELLVVGAEHSAKVVLQEASCDVGDSLMFHIVAVKVVLAVVFPESGHHTPLRVVQERLTLSVKGRLGPGHPVAVVSAMSGDVALTATGKALFKTRVEGTVSRGDVCQTGAVYRSVVGCGCLCTIIGEEPEPLTGGEEEGEEEGAEVHSTQWRSRLLECRSQEFRGDRSQEERGERVNPRNNGM